MDGCDRSAVADGMCGTHFQRWWKRDCDHHHRAWRADDDDHDPPIPAGLLEAIDARLTAIRDGDSDGAVRRLFDLIVTIAGRNA